MTPNFPSDIEEIKSVGRYQIIRKLGKGGAGIVFLGRDPYIKRNVAIKIANTATEKSRGQFLSEAQSAGRLNHPNIVSIHDAGIQDEFCYIAMEYIEGSTLAKFCRPENLFNLTQVIEIILQTCEALNYAHEKGVIHRDIKPPNIMLTKSGDVKITDFGIAQIAENTVALGLFGTPSYMSPEQLKEEVIDCTSDIFSLGCVLYELIAGKKAFDGKNLYEIMYKITHSEPESLINLRPDLSPDMEEIVRKTLAKKPLERYQSCMDLAYDLAAVLRGKKGISRTQRVKDIAKFVRRLEFFREFSLEQVRAVLAASHVYKAPKGMPIMVEGAVEDTFSIILNGTVKVEKSGQTLAVIGKGECFGEMACISTQARTANVVAVTDCILMRISTDVLQKSADSTKYLFYKNFAKTLVHRLSETSLKARS